MSYIDYNELRAPQLAGVYKIENKFTNKVYIGESVNIGNRIARHIDGLISHSHDNVNMQEDYDKYGITDFKFSILQLADQDKINKTDLVNYLLYMESAYYRKFEKYYDLYNIVVPYQAIAERNVSIPFYDIDFDKVKELLSTDPYNIGYEKIEWNPSPPPILTLEEILDQQSNYDADKFELAISICQNFNLKKYEFFQTYKYSECQNNGRRSLLCILKEVGNIKITNRREYFPRAYLEDCVSDKYIYQDEIYYADKAKIKTYLNCQKPMMLSYEAQLDIINYLKNLNEEMLKQIDIDYKQFQINYFMKNSCKIEIDNYLYREHNLPYTVNVIF